MIRADFAAPPILDGLQRRALLIGVVGLAVLALGLFLSPAQFFRSYLLAFMFVIGIALGSLAILMVQHLSGGAWGLVIRRVLESATRTFPLILLLFLPVVAGLILPLYSGLSPLFPWADHEAMASDPVLKHKEPYLNVPFFLIRAAVYFAVWLGLAYLFNKWSREQDLTGERRLKRKLQDMSGPGLVIFGGTVTFASIDWVMSLDPHWFSTIFGVLVMGGQALSAMAFAITVLFLLSSYKPMSDVLTAKHFHDLGKLLLAFVMLWAYFSFSQFLIIWSGNLPEEITWYIGRIEQGYRWIAGLLILFHFALPFFLLLPRNANRNRKLLAGVAVMIIVMRYVDLFWLIGPSAGHGDSSGHHVGGFVISWMDLAAPLGLGGIWLAYFIRELGKMPLMPIQDPYLDEALAHGRGEGH